MIEKPEDVYVSRDDYVHELHYAICQTLSSQPKGLDTSELMRLSRLWKFEGNDTLDDAREMVAGMKSDFSVLPFQI